jgi:small subunit ribosomal protein S6
MLRYETLFLAIPELTYDEFAQLESNINKTIQAKKGVLLSCERWGKYRLTYPIRNNEYGIYGLVRFEVEAEYMPGLLSTLKDLFAIQCNDIIMRTMSVALDPKQSLIYHRPESLEDTPVRDVDTFLKENKMEGLMSSKKSAHAVVEDVEDELEVFEENQDSAIEG